MSQYDRYNHIDSIQCVLGYFCFARGVAALWGIYFPFVMKFFRYIWLYVWFYWLFSYFFPLLNNSYIPKNQMFFYALSVFSAGI